MWQPRSPWNAWLAQQFLLQHWEERLGVSHDSLKKQNSGNMLMVIFIIRSWFRKPWPPKEYVKAQVYLRAKATESRCPGSGYQVEKIHPICYTHALSWLQTTLSIKIIAFYFTHFITLNTNSVQKYMSEKTYIQT